MNERDNKPIEPAGESNAGHRTGTVIGFAVRWWTKVSVGVKYSLIIGATAIASVGLVESRHLFAPQSPASDGNSIQSPYSGEETRGIKALSPEDVEGLLAGTGTPLGGLAKPAELNGYPGPRHVLEAIEQGEFEVNGDQQEQIEALYIEMNKRAIELGEAIVATEQQIDDAFAANTMTEAFLQENVDKSAALTGELRTIHLKYHLAMMDILTSDQVARYNDLRGYATGDDQCGTAPEGHDQETWERHNCA